ncbi:MAG: hypothetical protein M0Z91_08845 [Actinomycetota bacterium]|nr:hypothetical protein [Actinomycetota bacterium]
MSRLTTAGTAATLLAVATVAAACGGSSSAGTTNSLQPKLERAVAATEATPAAEALLSETVTSGSTTRMALSAKAGYSGSGKQYVNNVALIATAPLKQSVQLAVVGSTLYVTVPPSLKAFVPSGIHYVSVSYSKMLAALEQSGNAGEIATGVASQPTALLLILKLGQLSAVTQARGAPSGTEAYSVSLSLPTGKAGAGLAALGIPPVKTAKVSVWVGSNGLVSRISMNAALPAAAGSPGESLTATALYSGFGNYTQWAAIPAVQVLPESPSMLASVLGGALG